MLHLDVVVAGDGDNLQLLLGRRLEGLVFDSQPLHSGPVQLPEQGHDPGLLSGSGRSVNEQMRKVSSLDEMLQVVGLTTVVVELGKLLGAVLVEPESHFRFLEKQDEKVKVGYFSIRRQNLSVT